MIGDTTHRPLTVIFPATVGPASQQLLAQRLSVALTCGVTPVVADLTRTVSCGPRLIGLLADAARQALEQGIDLRLAIPVPVVHRAVAQSAFHRLFPIYATLDQALSAAPASRRPEPVKSPATICLASLYT